MWIAYAAAVVLGLTVMICNQALRWLNEPGDWRVWSGYLTITAVVITMTGSLRWLWQSQSGKSVLLLTIASYSVG
jgi:hypothetical protein